MTNNDYYNKHNILTNHANANVKIKLSMFNGQIDGNIFDKPIPQPIPDVCIGNALDFSCEENTVFVSTI